MNKMEGWFDDCGFNNRNGRDVAWCLQALGVHEMKSKVGGSVAGYAAAGNSLSTGASVIDGLGQMA